jgi:hypothetical protein
MSEDDYYEPFDLEDAPLEAPLSGGADWGGDGSDPTRPVRAHVLAALQPTTEPYPPPLDILVTLGDPGESGRAEDIATLPLTNEHVADLVRMARDRDLYTADYDMPESWAHGNALIALMRLDPTPVITDLIPLLDLFDDYAGFTLTNIFTKGGAASIDPLIGYLNDHSRWSYGRSEAINALEKIATEHPDTRDRVVEVVSDILRNVANEDEIVISSAVNSLVELQATEALPLIREAFTADKVDETMRGDWADVQRELGITPDPNDPLNARSRQRQADRLAEFRASVARNRSEPPASTRTVVRTSPPRKSHKAKNKRKQQSKARKANKRKK